MGNGGSTSVDGFAKGVELLEGDVPLAGEDVAGELSPVCRDGEIRVGGEDAEVVEIVGSPAVVPVRVLEFAEVVEGGDLLKSDLTESRTLSDEVDQFNSRCNAL